MEKRSRNTSLHKLANENWLGGEKKSKKEPVEKVIGKIYNQIDNSETTWTLDELQSLELYLWPTFDNNASKEHVILIASMAHGEFGLERMCEDGVKFKALFHQIVQLLDQGELSPHLVSFLSLCFGNLQLALIRKLVAPLISIGIWNCVDEKVVEGVLAENAVMKKAWNGSRKKFENATQEKQAEIKFNQNWLHKMILRFIEVCTTSGESEFIEPFLEFIIVLLSQVPTRRYTNLLIQNLNVSAVVHLNLKSKMVDIFDYYAYFPIDDYSGEALDEIAAWKRHSKDVNGLQQLAYGEKFKEKLGLLALANFGSIHNRVDLEDHLGQLNTDELFELAKGVNIRTKYANNVKVKRKLATECLVQKYLLRKPLNSLIGDNLDLLPTESTLFSPVCQRLLDYQDAKLPLDTPLPVHKLGQQYLSLEDFWVRSILTLREEYICRIRRTVQKVVGQVKPQTVTIQRRQKHRSDSDNDDDDDIYNEGAVVNDVKMGVNKDCLKAMNNPVVLDVGPPLVGEEKPSFVLVEIDVDLGKFPKRIRRGWEKMKAGDLVYLLNLKTPVPSATNDWEKVGIDALRCAEVVKVLDANSNPVRDDDDDEDDDDDDEDNEENERRRYRKIKRKIHVHIDSVKYGLEHENTLINHLNAVVRGDDVGYSKVKELNSSKPHFPEWLIDAFLGYGGVEIDSVTEKIDYVDTFKDLNQVKGVFDKIKVEKGVKTPPFSIGDGTVSKGGKMRAESSSVTFSNAQLEAIINGVTSGLSMVRGPPGAGKKTTCSQLLNIIHHNFSSQRSLVIAKFTSTIDAVWECLGDNKIERHKIFRLDDYTKSPIWEVRSKLLQHVSRLCTMLNISGAYDDSCETAEHLFSQHVFPAWTRCQNEVADGTPVESCFPFERSIFDDEKQSEAEKFSTAAQWVEANVKNVASTLAYLRPFELLRTPRALSKYMMDSAAQVVLATDEELKKSSSLNFDNIIILDAAHFSETDVVQCFKHTQHRQLRRLVLAADDDDNVDGDGGIVHRMIHHGRVVELSHQYFTRSALSKQAPGKAEAGDDEGMVQNAGLLYPIQFVNVGESDEAEYAVCLYRYLRLIGYPQDRITIVATGGDTDHLQQLANQQCATTTTNEAIFGLPSIITPRQFHTRSEIVILSLQSVGDVRPREIIAATSRATSGLYILGKKKKIRGNSAAGRVIDSVVRRSADLEENDLVLVTGELYNKTTRTQPESDRAVKMEGLAHLSAYVEDMTQQRIEYERKKSSRH